MADGAASSNKRKEQPEEAADSERNVRPRIDDSSGAPKLASLEGLKALRALPDLVDSRSLASASRGWFWRVRDSLLGGIISRLTAASSVLRRRAPQLELWEIEAVLPQMEASAKEICDLWCTLRNRLETQLRRQKWCQLARECLALGQDELPINLDGLDVMSVETQSFAMPAVSVIPPPPTQPPPPPPGNGVTPAPFQGPVTMPLLGPGPAPAVAALGPGTAVPAAVAAPAFAAQAPGVQNMPGTLPAQFLGVLPMPNPPAAGVAGVAGAALPVAPPVATAIASNTAQQVAGVVHQLINQVMQGPAGGAAGAAPATAAGQRETVRLNIVRVIEFSLADQRVAGRLYLGFETEGQRENGGTEARSAPRPDILCVEVELAVDAGKFTQLCSAHRMVHIAAGENRSFGPWTCTERREVEKRWLELRAKALGVQGLSLDLRHFMRLMAGLLGAALLTEPVSHRRLWNGLKPVVVGPSPMARLRVGLGGMNLTTSFPEPKDRDSGALPMGPAELLAHLPFADYVL